MELTWQAVQADLKPGVGSQHQFRGPTEQSKSEFHRYLIQPGTLVVLDPKQDTRRFDKALRRWGKGWRCQKPEGFFFGGQRKVSILSIEMKKLEQGSATTQCHLPRTSTAPFAGDRGDDGSVCDGVDGVGSGDDTNILSIFARYLVPSSSDQLPQTLK